MATATIVTFMSSYDNSLSVTLSLPCFTNTSNIPTSKLAPRERERERNTHTHIHLMSYYISNTTTQKEGEIRASLKVWKQEKYNVRGKKYYFLK